MVWICFLFPMYPSLCLLITRKDGPRLIQEAGKKARPETDWAKMVLLGRGQVVEKFSRRLKPPQGSLLNTRLGRLLIFLAILSCPANFHIFEWLLSYHKVCLPAFTLYISFSFHLSPPGSLHICFPLPFFSFPIYKPISSCTLSHCYL